MFNCKTYFSNNGYDACWLLRSGNASDDSGRGYELASKILPNQSWYFGFWDFNDNGREECVTPIRNWQQNQWYNLTFTRNGLIAQLYVNGVLIASATNSTPYTPAQRSPLYIGAHAIDPATSDPTAAPSGSGFFTGIIYDVRFYNRGLSTDEVQQLYSHESGDEAQAKVKEAQAKAKADAQAIRAKAENGDAQSQKELGDDLLTGSLGIAKDAMEAAKWYRKAAEQNLADAQYNLAVCYEQGTGVAKDEAEAVKWYCKAAEQNLANAQCKLGVCYEQGIVVAKNEMEAVKWFRTAAEQNNAQAQFYLGDCYLNARGVGLNYNEGYGWILLAATQGLSDAKEAEAVLRYRLGHDAIVSGQKMVSNFNSQEIVSRRQAENAELNAQMKAEAQALAEKVQIQIESQAKEAQTQAEKARVQAELQAKEAQAQAKAQAQIDRANKLPGQVSLIVVVAFVAAWMLFFVRLIIRQRQPIAQINLTPIFKQYYKPLFLSGLILFVGIAVVRSMINNRREARAFYEAVESVRSGYSNISDSDQGRSYTYLMCMGKIEAAYSKYDIIGTNWIHGSYITGKDTQTEMDSATRAALAAGVSKGTHEDMLRDAIVESANDPRRNVETIDCELQITHRVRK
jgi:TPR repeat protein